MASERPRRVLACTLPWAAAVAGTALVLLLVSWLMARAQQGFFTVPARTVWIYGAVHLLWLAATAALATLPAALLLAAGRRRLPARILRLVAAAIAAYLLLRWTGRHPLLPEDAFLRYGLPARRVLSPQANTLLALLCGALAAVLPASCWRRLRGVALPAVIPLLAAAALAAWDRIDPEAFHPGRRPPTLFEQATRFGEATLGDVTRPVLPIGDEPVRRLRLRASAGGEVSGAFALLPEAAAASAGTTVRARASLGEGESWSWSGTTGDAASAWQEFTLPLAKDATVELTLEVEGIPATAALWARPGVGRPRTPGQWNLLLVSLDTLRADRLGCYGCPRPTSPRLDALAAEGVLFERAFANAPWTRPSQMTLLTGLMPSAHGLELPLGEGNPHLDPQEVQTLAALLSRQGFRTAAVTGSSAISARFGFASGFHRYQEIPMVHLRDRPPEHLAQIIERSAAVPDDTILDVDAIAGAAMDWVSAHRGQRFFLFFHTYEIHHPYTHTRFLADAGADPAARRLARYDSGIRVADDWLGRLLDHLEGLGLLDRTLVVVTSDHGEDLGEHDDTLLHGHHQYNVLLHVPLILRAPSLLPAGWRSAEPVQHLDVVPTILGLLGVQAPAALPGRDLSPLWKGGRLPPAWILAEANDFGPEIFAVQDGHSKYWRIPEPDHVPPGPRPAVPLPLEALFDLDRDAGETDNLLPGSPPPAELKDALDAWLREARRLRALHDARRAKGGLLGLDPEQRARLRELGYLED